LLNVQILAKKNKVSRNQSLKTENSYQRLFKKLNARCFYAPQKIRKTADFFIAGSIAFFQDGDKDGGKSKQTVLISQFLT